MNYNIVHKVTLENPGSIMDWFTLHSTCSREVINGNFSTVNVLNIEPEILVHLAWMVGVGILDSVTIGKGSWKDLI